MTRAVPQRVAMILVLALLLVGCTKPEAPLAEVGTDGQSAVRQLDVGLTDFAIAASATTMPPGPIQLRVTNAGATAHDLRVEGAGSDTQTDVLRVSDTAVLDLDLTNVGALTLWCTLPGHRKLGMQLELEVVRR